MSGNCKYQSVFPTGQRRALQHLLYYGSLGRQEIAFPCKKESKQCFEESEAECAVFISKRIVPTTGNRHRRGLKNTAVRDLRFVYLSWFELYFTFQINVSWCEDAHVEVGM